MSFANSTPFYVLDEPYVFWSSDALRQNTDFLRNMDTDFYYRTTHRYYFDDDGNIALDDESDNRKPHSSLARLLWHHGLENLIMLLGAYVQAPHAVPGFYLKCRNEDVQRICTYLLAEEPPKAHALQRSDFKLRGLVSGMHVCANWTDKSETVDLFYRALSGMLQAYGRKDHRDEYNSVKHGLRASHGRFGLAIGIQEAPGIPAPADQMEMIGDSQDGSHFLVADPARVGSKREQRQHFSTRQASIGWSLEKVVCDLQLISILLSNLVSALRIAAGSQPGTVVFNRPDEAEEWWKQYFRFDEMPISNFSIGSDIVFPNPLPNAKRAAERYYDKLSQDREKTN